MDKKTLIRIGILSSILIFISVIAIISIGLGTGEILNSEIAGRIDFYQRFLPAIFVPIFISIIFMLIGKNNKYGDNNAFAELGEKPANPFFKRFDQFQIFLFSMMFFSLVFLVVNYLKISQNFTDLRVLPQQFSNIQSIFFSTLLIPIPENLFLGAIMSLGLLVLMIIAIRMKFTESQYKSYAYVLLPILAGIFAVIWHKSAYPTSDINIIIIFVFWGVGAIINFWVGSFIPFWIMHTMNNFTLDYIRLFSQQSLIIALIIIFLISLGLYIWWSWGNILGKKKEVEVLT